MSAFAATYIDAAGRRRSGRFEATSTEQVLQLLRSKAVWPVSVRQLKPNRRHAGLTIPPGEFVPFLHQFELQVRAGVTADVALAQLAEDTPPGNLRILLDHIHGHVAQGRPIHEACRYFHRQFPPHLAAVIAAGEASAQLPEALRALAVHLTGVEELRRTTRRALIYPLLVLSATAGLIAFLLGGVVPQFSEVFTSLSLKLPLLTIVLIDASTWVRSAWPVLFAGGFTGLLAIVGATRSEKTRAVRDRLFMHVPILGETVRLLATARFAAHCRLLHDAGVPLLDALKTGAELTGQSVLADQLRQARNAVAMGKPLHQALPKNHAFPSFVVPALRAGETTGQLGTALHHIEDYATRRARDRIATALTFLEPTILGLLATVVGAIALSFFLPLLSLLGGINAR